MTELQNYTRSVISLSICTQEVADRWLKRAEEGILTREEGNTSHITCYFLPYNPNTKEVFVVAHKKSGLWLFPGGHVDEGELPMETLNREIAEELGIRNAVKEEIKPFLLTVTPIENKVQPCKEHLDMWFMLPTDGLKFQVDPREFNETRWVTIKEARELVTDSANREALNRIETQLY